MLSFTILNEENIEAISEDLSAVYKDADSDYIREILESLTDDDSEIALSHSRGCLLVRIFDGGYSFIYPIPLTDDARDLAACDDIRLYAIKEEIPLRLIDVPSEAVDLVCEKYLHVSVDFYDEEREAYELSILNEACRDCIPTLFFDGLTLDALSEADDREYARLSMDEETNRFWGYDFSEDNPDPEVDYFRLESEAEFDRGIAMSFAVRQGGVFLGEATLYAFDYLGGAELAIRILPEYRRLGIAGRIIDGFKREGAALGLINVRATVMEENLRSVALCKKHFETYTREGKIYKFVNKT